METKPTDTVETRYLNPEDFASVVRIFQSRTEVHIHIDPVVTQGVTWWGIAAEVGDDRIELGKSFPLNAQRKLWRSFERAYQWLQDHTHAEVITVRIWRQTQHE